MIELKAIQMIKAIEEEGSFQKAADVLYLSQPALSQYVKRVEKELSFNLYERSGGKCTLTEAGEVLLEEGTALLEQYEKMLQKMKDVAKCKQKRVFFGCPTGYSVPWFSDFLYGMESNVKQVRMMEDSVEHLISKLLRKELDMLFIPAVYYHPNIVHYTICHEEFYVAIPKNSEYDLIARSKKCDGYVDMSDLSGLPFISGPAKAYTEFLRPIFEETGMAANVIFVAKNWDIAHAFVEKGAGSTIVPYWLVNDESKYVNYYKIKSNCNTYRIFSYALHRQSTITDEMQSIIDNVIDKCGDEFAEQEVEQSQLILNFNAKTAKIYSE